MIPKLCLVSLFAGLLLSNLPTPGLAQDDEPTYDISVWHVIAFGEDGLPIEPEDNENLLTEVLFITLDEGATLVAVWVGGDVIYTLDEKTGLYTGRVLIPGDFQFVGTLEVLDQDTMQSIYIQTFDNQPPEALYLQYKRIENENYTLYVELDRTVEEYSLFKECFGITMYADKPPSGISTPDLLVPLEIDTEANILVLGTREFLPKEDVYQYTDISSFGSEESVTTETLLPQEDASFAYLYHYISGNRDNCEVTYSSTFIPFDGNFEALFARAEELAEITEE
jgi:hypothetical protein